MIYEYKKFIICEQSKGFGVWFDVEGWQDSEPIGYHSCLNMACIWIDGYEELRK